MPVCRTNKSRFKSRKEIEGRGLGEIISHIPFIRLMLEGIFGGGALNEFCLPGAIGGGKKSSVDGPTH